MKVSEENSRIRIQDPDPNPDPNPDPDPLVRGMDPRIRIRIHPKISWIRNTAKGTVSLDGFGGHVWLVLGLNRGLGQFLNFLGPPMIL